MLKKHAQKAAIEAIEQALYVRGHGHLLAGQPLKLVANPGSASTSVKTNESSKRDAALEDHHKSSSLKMLEHEVTRIPPQLAVVHDNSRESFHRHPGSVASGHPTLPLDRSLPVMLPSKRLSSPGGVPENPSKKQKQNRFSGCPVCLGPLHPVESCPVVHEDTYRFVCSYTRFLLFLSWALVSQSISCDYPRTRLKGR